MPLPALPTTLRLLDPLVAPLRDGMTLLRAGLVRPERPDRLARAGLAIMSYGVGVGAGVAAGAARFPYEIALVDDAGPLSWQDLETRSTPYAVRVHLASRTLELLHGGRVVGQWSVAVGAPGTPTPTGLTFVHALLQDPAQSFSPYIIPLGTHSATLDTYGGGPGTVAFHGWPDASVFGQAVSHGCIRVPAEALERLMDVPLGTLVSVDQQ